MIAMDDWETDVACDACADRGCAKCDPLIMQLERERLQPRQRPPDTSQGPTRTYAEWQRDRTCTSKRVYTHQLAAREAILDIAKRDGPDMTEYRCPHCQLWHLTTSVTA